MAEHFLSVTEASRRGVSRMVKAAQDGDSTVIVRHGKAVAVCLPLDDYEHLLEAEERHALVLRLMHEAPLTKQAGASLTAGTSDYQPSAPNGENAGSPRSTDGEPDA